MNETSREIEKVARLSYGRLVAILSSRLHSLQEAEDALSDGLVRALQTWPRDGVPANPEAWLLKTSFRKAIDRGRHAQLRERYAREIEPMMYETDDRYSTGNDERLRLMFICADASVDPAVRAPLMLQVILGLDARRMASVFLVSPGTLGQRLTRAKARIESSQTGSWSAGPEHREERVADVLNAIYGAYAVAYNGGPAGDQKSTNLTQEAIWLASLVAAEMPKTAEAHGLFALMLFSEARRNARVDPVTKAMIPLERQNTKRWDMRLLADAEQALRNAARHATLGRFQLEASIQAVHANRRVSGLTDWHELERLYHGLVHVCPTAGAITGLAATLGRTRGGQAGLDVLDQMDNRLVANYQPWWATRAHLLGLIDDREKALEAYGKAIGLCDDPAARIFLSREKAKLLDG